MILSTGKYQYYMKINWQEKYSSLQGEVLWHTPGHSFLMNTVMREGPNSRIKRAQTQVPVNSYCGASMFLDCGFTVPNFRPQEGTKFLCQEQQFLPHQERILCQLSVQSLVILGHLLWALYRRGTYTPIYGSKASCVSSSFPGYIQ
eukprot:XP_012821902.1 PREDICTED: cyclin-dependent kinase 2-associated protein 2 isoform X2 [Xenopus tropicalis]